MNRHMPPPAGGVPHITITNWNRARLDSLLSNHKSVWSWRAVEFLVRELMRSDVVDESAIPAGIVTMRSRVAFRDDSLGLRQVVTLAYPGEQALYEDGISILTPVGAALIGLAEGQSISYAAPDGRPKTVTVLQVLYQPEASQRS